MQDLISAKFALENLFSKPNTIFLDATFICQILEEMH